MDYRTKLVGALIFGLTCTGALAARHTAQVSQPLDFKTLVIGAPTTPQQVETALAIPCGVSFGPGPAKCDDLDKKIQEMRRVKCGDSGDGRQICNGTTTMAVSPAEVNLVIGTNGMIERIHLTISDLAYDEVNQALNAKFGAAQHVSHPTLQNGFGATFRQENSLWNGPGGTELLLSQYAGDTDHSSVYFSTRADRDLVSGVSHAPSSDL